MNDPRVPKQRTRIIQELEAELWNLRLACEQWELGHFQQTTTIAKTLRVLLYDYLKSSKSLFAQLGMKAKPFLTTGRLNNFPKRRSYYSLAHFRIKTAPTDPKTPTLRARRYWEPNYFYPERRPPFSADDALFSPEKCTFLEWWNQTVVSGERHSLTRGDIIGSVSNELGGTHSAELIRPSTQELLDGKLDYPDKLPAFTLFGLTISDETAPPENTMFDAVVRQIAYEVQCTVDRFHKDITRLKGVVPPFPPSWDATEGFLHIEQDPKYLELVIKDLRRAADPRSVQLKELEAQLYWYEYRDDLFRRGLGKRERAGDA